MNRPGGWFVDEEGKEIQDIVRSISPNGIIVEIGTWSGLSTSYIAEAMTVEQTLITIDNYLDDSEASHAANLNPQIAQKIFLEFFFKEQLFKKRVIPLIGSSTDIAELFKKSSSNINFLFIDGDHKYESVKNDYYAWSTFIPSYVAFHDYTNCTGVENFVNEIKDDYKYFKLIGSVAVLKEKKMNY